MRLRNCFGMIWSVSTFSLSSGAASPVWRTNGCIASLPLPDIDEVPLHRRRGRHGRTDEVRPAQLALPALEVPVGGRGAALAGLENVRVHPQAHRAACLAPVESRFPEDPVEPLRLGLTL